MLNIPLCGKNIWRKYMKKILAILLTVLLIGGSLWAAGEREMAAQGKVEIEVFYPIAVDAPIAKILGGYIASFQSINPNITVTPVFSGGYGDVKTAIQTTIEGGGKPPAMGVMLATDLYDLMNSGYIASIDDYLAVLPKSDAYINGFYPAFLENSRYDGKIWSIPFQRSAVVLYYNKDMFKAAGLSRPDSWETLAEAAKKLTKRSGDNVTQWGIEFPSGWPYWLFQPLAIGAGQNIVGDDDLTVYFDDPAVIEAVESYIALSKHYKATPPGVQGAWGTAPANFSKGTTAMIVHSTGSLATIIAQSGFDVGVMPLPGKKTGTYASVPGGGNFYIMDGASEAEKAAAVKFAHFITQPELAADFSINTGYIAVQKSAYNTSAMKAYLTKVPQAADTRDALNYAEKELSLQNLGEVRNIFHKYLQAAFNGEMTASKAMKTAQEEADKSLADFR
jgi:sn-glycerol 3-phosphate transport system substrate-binding protein